VDYSGVLLRLHSMCVLIKLRPFSNLEPNSFCHFTQLRESEVGGSCSLLNSIHQKLFYFKHFYNYGKNLILENSLLNLILNLTYLTRTSVVSFKFSLEMKGGKLQRY